MKPALTKSWTGGGGTRPIHLDVGHRLLAVSEWSCGNQRYRSLPAPRYAVQLPFLARPVLNTETVQRQYISSSASADRNVKGLSLPVTPFMTATFGMVLVTILMTVTAYW
ncbi:hypothetical protein [Rossellomorea marisflavi]|uniref:hypothetical protein n=1 Tax=Rossellomorea marisflavi TaxID=189381 RepID=UPI003517B772